jgi:tRNA U54 and U55 pseudouridine synthase Pus10
MRKGHPQDVCRRVCHVCKEVHEKADCPAVEIIKTLKDMHAKGTDLPEELKKHLNMAANEEGLGDPKEKSFYA